MTDARTPTPIDRIAEDWLTTSIELDPTLAVWLGRAGFEGRYADLSPDGVDAAAEAARRARLALHAAPVLDDVDRVTALELGRELDLALEQHAAGAAYRDLAVIASPAQGIREVFDLEPTDGPDDWAHIAARLGALPAALDGYVATLRAGITRHTTPALRQVLLVAEETEGWARQSGFFGELAARGAAAGTNPALAHTLEVNARLAAAAYGRFAEFLRAELAPAATTADGVGRERYALASRAFLGATIDLDETYEWGLDELARMVDEQERVARTIHPDGVDAAIAALDADPARSIAGTDALREWMQETSDAAIAALAGTWFAIPEPLRRLECLIAPTTTGEIYYTSPSDDLVRPGRMWWSVPEDVTRFSTWRERTTVYHEGVPGHHLQLGTAVLQKDRLNAWRRNAGTSGHAEGWALYAERQMAELGFLDDPADRLGMLDGQRMRAARVVVDIGVHLGKRLPDGGGVWTADSALQFFRQHVHTDDSTVRFEVNRYLGWPGQAPSYKVGQRIWEEVRRAASEKAGAGFDVRAFHAAALELGGVGLDTLRSALID